MFQSQFRVNNNNDGTVTVYRTRGTITPYQAFKISYADLFILLQVAKLMRIIDYRKLGDGESFELTFPRDSKAIKEFMSANNTDRVERTGQENVTD